MSEPHQRVRSGKLRPASKYGETSDRKRLYEKRIVHTGVENATELVHNDNDDEYATYLQTPTTLCKTQVDILREIASGYGINRADCIDEDSRKTWNIGTWHVGDKLSICINLRQPNIWGCWANIHKIEYSIVNNLAQHYTNQELQSSKCRVSLIRSGVQVQGRWVPLLIDTLIEQGHITKNNVNITILTIGQSALFCWIVLSTGSKYLCYLTKESINIITRYIPEWCMSMDEASSGGSTTLKIRRPDIENDASQLSISDTGALSYQGRIENIKKLPEALKIAIDRTMESIHLPSFLDSLEYKSIDQ